MQKNVYNKKDEKNWEYISKLAVLYNYSILDSFGSSTVPGHLRINIFVFSECQSISIY